MDQRELGEQPFVGEPMRILVCGGRSFANLTAVYTTLDDYLPDVRTVIHGGEQGADQIAGEWAERNGVAVHVFPAQWQKYGKAAGPIRNAQMLEEGHPDLVIAFPGGRGTADMCRKALRSGVDVINITEEWEET